MVYVSSACIRKNHIAEIIQDLVVHDIKNIELSGGTNYYDGIQHDLKTLKQRYHLYYACHAYFPPPQIPFVVNLASCNDQIYCQSIDHYVQCIEMLKQIDCKVLSIHAGFLIEIDASEVGKKISKKIIYDEEKAYDRFCTAYDYIARICAENDIRFYLENNVLSAENYKEFHDHNYMMMTDHASIMKMKTQIDFNLLLDLGHLFVSSKTLGRDYDLECGMLQKYVKWIHISENDGIFDEHKPLKSESEIMKGLKKIYRPYMNMTLESVGTIEEVSASVELLKSLEEEQWS